MTTNKYETMARVDAYECCWTNYGMTEAGSELIVTGRHIDHVLADQGLSKNKKILILTECLNEDFGNGAINRLYETALFDLESGK